MMGSFGTAENFIDTQPVADATQKLLEFYENRHAAVYHVALRVTGNPADAEDVLQTVFLRIFGTLSRGENLPIVRNQDAWFKRAACNAAIDILRRRAARAEINIDDYPLKLVKTPETLLKEQLRRAIATLEPEDAELFILRYVEGFSNGELAVLFRQEKNNIAVRLHRIRHTLQIELK